MVECKPIRYGTKNVWIEYSRWSFVNLLKLLKSSKIIFRHYQSNFQPYGTKLKGFEWNRVNWQHCSSSIRSGAAQSVFFHSLWFSGCLQWLFPELGCRKMKMRLLYSESEVDITDDNQYGFKMSDISILSIQYSSIWVGGIRTHPFHESRWSTLHPSLHVLRPYKITATELTMWQDSGAEFGTLIPLEE